MEKNSLNAIFVALTGISLLMLLNISGVLLFIVLLALWTIFWSWVYSKCK
jgi:hypothetical protein